MSESFCNYIVVKELTKNFLLNIYKLVLILYDNFIL